MNCKSLRCLTDSEKHHAKHTKHAKHRCECGGWIISSDAYGSGAGDYWRRGSRCAARRRRGRALGRSSWRSRGSVTGGVAGLLGVDERPRFRDYVIREHRSAYRLREPVTIGTVLPPEGVTFYVIPTEFGVPPSYRYAVVNDDVVLVDPLTRQIVDVID